jgi:hypothetical protein
MLQTDDIEITRIICVGHSPSTRRRVLKSVVGLGRVKTLCPKGWDEAGLRCDLLFSALTMLGLRPSAAGCP